MNSQSVDIYGMLNKAQTEYNQQQNSVAAFFMQASNGNPSRTMPMPISNVNSLEQIERQIRTSPPSNHAPNSHHQHPHHNYNNNNNNGLHNAAQPHLANSPLAQFFSSNNFNNAAPRPAPVEAMHAKETMNGQKISAPPGFNTKVQPQKNLLNNSQKETKLITPTMFAASNSHTEKKSPIAEPLTKNQLLQALNYLIENDDDFMNNIHKAYINSFRKLSS